MDDDSASGIDELFIASVYRESAGKSSRLVDEKRTGTSVTKRETQIYLYPKTNKYTLCVHEQTLDLNAKIQHMYSLFYFRFEVSDTVCCIFIVPYIKLIKSY